MLSTLILQGYGKKEGYNCSEKILYGANQVYNLGLDKQALKMSAGFGGGMAIGSVCGALTGAVMVLSILFVKNNAHESTRIKDLTQELFSSYKKAMDNIDCVPLKAKYYNDDIKCTNVIVKAAEVLEKIIQREILLNTTATT